MIDGDNDLSTSEILSSYTLHSERPTIDKLEEETKEENLEMISPDNFNFIQGLIPIPTSLTIDTSGVSDPNTRIDYNPLDSRLPKECS